MVFTGDTLFSGDVGRTDLAGSEHQSNLSGLLFDSLHDKILPLGDQVIVYPAHTAGSICGSRISDRDVTTVGIERKTNPLLSLGQGGVRKKQGREPYAPTPLLHPDGGVEPQRPTRSFGTPPSPSTYQIQDFESLWRQPDIVVVDTRNPDAFAASHIPDSLSIWLEGSSYHPGWVVDYDERIILVVERREDAEKATTYLQKDRVRRSGRLPLPRHRRVEEQGTPNRVLRRPHRPRPEGHTRQRHRDPNRRPRPG